MSVAGRFHGAYIHQRRVRVLSAQIAPLLQPNTRVLDVGAGDGAFARQLITLRPDLSVRGIDVLVRSHTLIPVDYYCGKIIPYKDGSFDVVLLIDVLHHSDSVGNLLRESLRVAKRAVIIKDHVSNSFWDSCVLRFMDIVGNMRHGVASPGTYLSSQGWSDMMASIGGRVVMWESKLGLYPFAVRWLFERKMHFIAEIRSMVSK